MYHAGDITGGGIKNLMGDTKQIFDGISEFLDCVAKENSVSEEVREEIKKTLDLYSICLQQVNGFFSRVRQRGVKEEDVAGVIKEASELLKAGMMSWQKLGLSVTPKLHVVECHIIPFMMDLGGLGNYDEEFVELSHPIGMRANVRNYFSRQDQVRKYVNMACWEHANANPIVTKIKKEAAEKRSKQKRISPDDASNKVSKKQAKKARREEGRQQSVEDASMYKAEEIRTTEEINIELSKPRNA